MTTSKLITPDFPIYRYVNLSAYMRGMDAAIMGSQGRRDSAFHAKTSVWEAQLDKASRRYHILDKWNFSRVWTLN